MRTPKFRIWDKLRKAFIFYGDIKEFAVELSGRGESLEFPISIYDEEEAVFQQSTGLLDKSGKEIYEGDVLKLSFNAMGIRDENNKPLFIVGMGDEEWIQREKNIEVKFKINKNSVVLDLESYLDTICPDRKSLTYEVIGNIFENKELLE